MKTNKIGQQSMRKNGAKEKTFCTSDKANDERSETDNTKSVFKETSSKSMVSSLSMQQQSTSFQINAYSSPNNGRYEQYYNGHLNNTRMSKYVNEHDQLVQYSELNNINKIKDQRGKCKKEMSEKNEYYQEKVMVHHTKINKNVEDDLKPTHHKKYLQIIVEKKEYLHPLKKRQRMHEMPYPTGHAVNIRVLPSMHLTFEEEFNIIDYQVRIEEFKNARFNFMNNNAESNLEHWLGRFLCCISKGQKLPFNKVLNSVVLGAAMKFASSNIANYFQQIEDIHTLKKAQNSIQLSIHLLMWGVLEGNLKEKISLTNVFL